MVRSIEKSNDLIGIRSRDLPACSIVPQPTVLPHAPIMMVVMVKITATIIIQCIIKHAIWIVFVGSRIDSSRRPQKIDVTSMFRVEEQAMQERNMKQEASGALLFLCL
jgi:hypothetical protein